jgi:hypothetical protein
MTQVTPSMLALGLWAELEILRRQCGAALTAVVLTPSCLQRAQ